jgi:hypothetical protein
VKRFGAFVIAMTLLLSGASTPSLSCCGQEVPAESHAKPTLDELNKAGIDSYRKGDYGKAEEIFRSALDTAYAANDQKWVGSLLSNLAAVYSAGGKHDDAKRLNLEAQSIKNKLSGPITKPPEPAKPAPASTPLPDASANPKSLSGYVSESEKRAGRSSLAISKTQSLQQLPGIFDPSYPPRLDGRNKTAHAFPSASAANSAAFGGVDWGPWPQAAQLPPPEPFFPSPPPTDYRPPRFHPPPPHGAAGGGACVPCQDNGVMVLIRVQGYGGFFGGPPGHSPGGPPPGGPGGPGGLFKMFVYSGGYSLGN